MKYRGYELEVVYLPAADFKTSKDGVVIARRPKKEDIDYVLAKPLCKLCGERQWREKSMSEAKKQIDLLIQRFGMCKCGGAA